MDSLYKKFYQKVYQRTGGFIPMHPLTSNVHPGDFFQIRNGELIFLGNIFNPEIVDQFEIDFQFDIKLNPNNWKLSDGITKPYSGRGSGHNPIDGDFEYSKQVISFEDKGSFIFKGHHPYAVRIRNWNAIQDQLIIKLTQAYYSFRSLYVVTDCAIMDAWTLAIAGKHEAELEIATEKENFGLVEIFGEDSVKTIQSKDVDYYHQEPHKKSCFFKAKKLVVYDDKSEVFISDLLDKRTRHQQWAASFFPYEFYKDDDIYESSFKNTQGSVLDMLQGNQLNPTTALNYFQWVNAGLDDIERLFITYGD